MDHTLLVGGTDVYLDELVEVLALMGQGDQFRGYREDQL